MHHSIIKPQCCHNIFDPVSTDNIHYGDVLVTKYILKVCMKCVSLFIALQSSLVFKTLCFWDSIVNLCEAQKQRTYQTGGSRSTSPFHFSSVGTKTRRKDVSKAKQRKCAYTLDKKEIGSTLG